jgi:arylsulfatase
MLSFIGSDLVATRWKQWRIYFTDVHPQTITGPRPLAAPHLFVPALASQGQRLCHFWRD